MTTTNAEPSKRRFADSPAFAVSVVLIGNAIAWLIPSNVAKLVAREQHVLLGRYSRAHFSWLVAAAGLSAIGLFIHLGPTPRARKRRAFGVIALALGTFPALVAVDLVLRMRVGYPYVPDEAVYHRPPGARYQSVYEDRPACHRSLPVTPEGYGRVECTMTYDAEGFRNAAASAKADIVTLGDSFTEGSRVSDDQSWPALLEQFSGRSVCNLGISGYGAPEYRAALERYGLPKSPRRVICLLYEGNDFRSDRLTARSGITMGAVVATSPIVEGIDSFLKERLGAIGADRRIESLSVMSWLPITIPDGPGGRHYAFAAKQLTELYKPREKFELDSAWHAVSKILKQIMERCDSAGAELIVVYAPLKARVVVPLVADRLPAADVFRFMRYKDRRLKAPEGDAFMPDLLAHLDNRESVVEEWCRRRGIAFVSLTRPLREAVLAGRQVYYTYDQHWSPAGHECAARAIIAALDLDEEAARLAHETPYSDSRFHGR